jgi:hypothetical protein
MHTTNHVLVRSSRLQPETPSPDADKSLSEFPDAERVGFGGVLWATLPRWN